VARDRATREYIPDALLTTHHGQLATCPFLANPDVVARLRQDAPLNAPEMATFCVPGVKGCTDSPALAA
jgi:hypothetical protein